MNSRLLFCDDSFAIVNKFAGEACSFDEYKTKEQVLKSYVPNIFSNLISNKLGYEPEIIECVNRIDKPVSGIVILALTKKSMAHLTNQLKTHQIKKIYYAIVEGCFKPFLENKSDCLLKNTITFNKKKQKAYILDKIKKTNKTKKLNNEEGKNAELLYRVVGMGERYSFLKIELLTGRTHQIRCQLSYNKMPIKGDLKYGAKRSESHGGIRLHAGELSLSHPETGEKLCFNAPFPYVDTLWKYFIDLGIMKIEK